MLTCREMALLGSDVIDRQLSLKQRIAVFVHLRHCKNCRLYIKQLAFTSAVLQQLMPETDSADVDVTLENIQRAIGERKA
ncbi:MAG: anti-sigma factor [Betaproteobacteria bacterium HGW-Betaproteobacteria-17]|nr:MAG: anti-sigma factor [Betaproteobacteria bacterium HGW-Betaproteobacteria-17]